MFLTKKDLETQDDFAERLLRHQLFQLELNSGFAPPPPAPPPIILQPALESEDPYGGELDLDDYGDF